VIYLQAPVDTLLARVRMRSVYFEQSMSDQYLARIADAYSRFFYQYDDAPLLIINSERLNFVDNRAHMKMLLARIAGMRAAANSSTSAGIGTMPVVHAPVTRAPHPRSLCSIVFGS